MLGTIEVVVVLGTTVSVKEGLETVDGTTAGTVVDALGIADSV